jgi:acyl-coenzyme A synthetase/AMP-(fatty) acid ligase
MVQLAVIPEYLLVLCVAHPGWVMGNDYSVIAGIHQNFAAIAIYKTLYWFGEII